MMNKKLLLLLAASLGLATACGSDDASDEGEKGEETRAVPVEAVAARQDAIEAFYSATATLEADGEAAVVPRVGGRITAIEVEEGDRVAAGDVLARIDDERLGLELARAESDLKRLRQDVNRQREMHERNMIATEAFERLAFELESQQAAVDLARLQLSYTAITAPIDGVVSERMIKVGNMVSTTEPVFRVTTMDPLLATLHVPERELARLAPGQVSVLRADALPGERFAGVVDRISPVVDAASGTFRVTVELRDPSGRLRPGMFGRFDIVHDRREQAVLVPVESVLIEDGEASIFVVDDGEAQRRSVEVGYRNNGDYEIVAGIEPGEAVVVTGQASLRSGARVQLIGDEPPQANAEQAVAEHIEAVDVSS
ncbi:efflux RND transporter periplasmic adaptor subunit [Wenzhouxiangella sp. EGI_FJ10409]|uniref:efflux RND transporter periplasmic adaptor subunit n=1 Tax=Wenzhouxiangella sp. EGI_FJ10409 TaxID=3243767 RepID=UPI0035DD9D2D